LALITGHFLARGHLALNKSTVCGFIGLSQTRFLRRNITPFLDHRLLDLPWVGPGPGAHLLGHVHTLLSGGELGDQLGHVLASTLRLQATFLLGGILDDSLCFVIALLISLFESTASRGTELPGLLGTASDGSVLLDILLGDGAHLLGPLGALGVGGVARGLIFTLLFNLGSALNNIILDIMDLLFGPALRLVLSSADLRSLNITVLNKRSSADLDSLIKSNLLVFDETVLPEVLLALLFLLGLVVGDIGGVTPLVVRVVTLDHIIILGLLNHLNLVNTLLAIITRPGGSNISEAYAGIIATLSGRSRVNSLVGGMVTMVMVFMVSMM